MEAEGTVVDLTIRMPEELAERLAGIAAAQHTSVEALAIEKLRALAGTHGGAPPGSAAALLLAMSGPPHLSPADVEELDAAIAASRLPNRCR